VVVFPPALYLIRRLDDDPDPHTTPGRPHQGVTHMRYAVDGIADEGDPLDVAESSTWRMACSV